jgi:hypothetical protein
VMRRNNGYVTTAARVDEDLPKVLADIVTD